MAKLFIICIDDQQEVLNALEQDLSAFEDFLSIEVCDSGREALELANEIDAAGDHLAIVISDQVMPEMTGVQVLSAIEEDTRFPCTQKILLTGLATHEDTIEAINNGGLDYYIQKPWNREHLTDIVKKGLTEFILKSGLDYESLLSILDQKKLYDALRNRTA